MHVKESRSIKSFPWYTGKFLPMVRNIVSNEDGAFTDKHGNAMPPCICMEKGESLDMWIKRIPEGLDMITALQVLVEVPFPHHADTTRFEM